MHHWPLPLYTTVSDFDVVWVMRWADSKICELHFVACLVLKQCKLLNSILWIMRIYESLQLDSIVWILSRSSWKNCHHNAKRQSLTWSKQGTSPVVHPQQQNSRTSSANSLLQQKSHRTHEQSQTPWDPLRENADVQDRSNQQTSDARKDCPCWKPWLHKALNNVICSCCIRVWNSLTIVWVSQPCHSPTCWSTTGYKTKLWESIWEQQKTHPLRLCATYWPCYPWKQDIKWRKSRCISMWCRIPRIQSTILSKKKRGVDWQEASHGWAKQNSQSSMCVASQSSSM